MKVYETIKKKVEDKGVTLTFLSKKTGIHINTISSCLNGKRQIKADELIKLCNVLEMSLTDFLSDRQAS